MADSCACRIENGKQVTWCAKHNGWSHLCALEEHWQERYNRLAASRAGERVAVIHDSGDSDWPNAWQVRLNGVTVYTDDDERNADGFAVLLRHALSAAVDGLASRAGEPNGIYVASRTRHARTWRELRAAGYPIVASWIDEAGPGETADYADLMWRCAYEASHAQAIVLYAEADDIAGWKGAWFELGAAVACGVPAFFVGVDDSQSALRHPASALRHPAVTCCDSLAVAMARAAAVAGFASQGGTGESKTK